MKMNYTREDDCCIMKSFSNHGVKAKHVKLNVSRLSVLASCCFGYCQTTIIKKELFYFCFEVIVHVNVSTVDAKWASTDNHVYITLHGDECRSDRFELDNSDKDDFEAAHVDGYSLKAKNIGNQVSSQTKIQ